MGTFAATDLQLTVSHRQFGLETRLVMIVLLGLVSTTSMEQSILCLFDFIFLFIYLLERIGGVTSLYSKHQLITRMSS